MSQTFAQSVGRTIPQPKKIKFASLGLVVLDEIHFHSKATQKDVVGGSGSYSMSLYTSIKIKTALDLLFCPPDNVWQ